MLGNIPNMVTHEIFLLKNDRRDVELFAFFFYYSCQLIYVSYSRARDLYEYVILTNTMFII